MCNSAGILCDEECFQLYVEMHLFECQFHYFYVGRLIVFFHLQLSFVKLQCRQALGLSILSVLMHHAYRSHWLQGSACDLGEVLL